MKKKLLLLMAMLYLASCASVGEKVITRMDGVDEKPKWANLSTTMYTKDGKVYSVGFTEVGARSRVSAAARISDNNARFEISRNVTDDMAFIFQNMEEGIDDSGTLARFYGTEVSKLIANGIRQEKRYWEKVKTFDDYGEPVYRLRVYSLASIKKSDLRKAISVSLNKGRGITPQIKDQIDQHITREIQKLGEL